MTIELDFDPLALEHQEREVEIPFDVRDRTRGSVCLTLREYPYQVQRSIGLRSVVRAEAWKRAGDYPKDFGTLTAEAADALAGGHAADYAFLREVIRWGVIDHRAEDLRARGQPIPFVAETVDLAGVPFRVCSAQTFALYAKASGDEYERLRPWAFLVQIADAVTRFQDGRILTCEELWEEWRRPTREECEIAVTLILALPYPPLALSPASLSASG